VDWFEDKSKWEKLTSFGMVESERQIGDKTTHETRYYTSSLPSDALAFAQAARGHWGIENGLHWPRGLVAVMPVIPALHVSCPEKEVYVD
jgi:hypothetical protein